MLNMAVPVPALDMINIDPSTMLGNSKFHLHQLYIIYDQSAIKRWTRVTNGKKNRSVQEGSLGTRICLSPLTN